MLYIVNCNIALFTFQGKLVLICNKSVNYSCTVVKKVLLPTCGKGHKIFYSTTKVHIIIFIYYLFSSNLFLINLLKFPRKINTFYEFSFLIFDKKGSPCRSFFDRPCQVFYDIQCPVNIYTYHKYCY